MTNLVFATEDVKPLVAHARASKQWHKTYEEVEGPAKPALWLVKDEGIYLMSNGNPRQMADGTESLVAYAQGFDPRVGDRMDVYEAAREAVGGDDFADALPIEWFEDALSKDALTKRRFIVLKFEPDSIEVLA